MTKSKILGAAALALALAVPLTTARAAEELGVGSKAPRLENVTWLQGEPVPSWKEGQVYVLDFWATWCGPCKATIPHVNELSKTYADKGVHVIGVAIWPRNGMVPTAEFVAQKGDAMSYGIAEDVDGKTAEAFMDASLSNGIPTVMIVDRKGTIAYIGHPAGMDEPLEKIVAGTADMAQLAAADAKRREALRAEYAMRETMEKIMPRIKEAYARQDWPTALAAVDELVAIDAKNPSFARLKYSLLLKSGDARGAATYGKALVETTLHESANGLNELAWYIVDPDGELSGEQRDLALAMSAAVRADELTGHKSASILDTLARVHFHKGEFAKAVEVQTKAIDVASEEDKAQLTPALEEYKRAANS